MLVIAGGDHDRIQLWICQYLFGILVCFGRLAEEFMSVVGCALRGLRSIDRRRCGSRILDLFGRKASASAMPDGAVAAAYLTDLYPIVCADDPAIGPCRAGQ